MRFWLLSGCVTLKYRNLELGMYKGYSPASGLRPQRTAPAPLSTTWAWRPVPSPARAIVVVVFARDVVVRGCRCVILLRIIDYGHDARAS